MRRSPTALGGIGQAEKESLVPPGQGLKALVSPRREAHRLPREIEGRVIAGADVMLKKVLVREDGSDRGHGPGLGFVRQGRRLGRRSAVGSKPEIQKPVGVVEGRSQDLAAGNILEGGRDPPADIHPLRVHGL